jgi:hypothetical protein
MRDMIASLRRAILTAINTRQILAKKLSPAKSNADYWQYMKDVDMSLETLTKYGNVKSDYECISKEYANARDAIVKTTADYQYAIIMFSTYLK